MNLRKIIIIGKLNQQGYLQEKKEYLSQAIVMKRNLQKWLGQDLVMKFV